MLLSIFIGLVIILVWLVLSPVIVTIDTRIPIAKCVWRGIGNAALTYKEEEWILSFRILFYAGNTKLSSVKRRTKKHRPKQKKKKKMNVPKMIQRIMYVMKSFSVPEWKLSIDTGNFLYNAWLYPLNVYAGTDHCNINFYGQNYLVLELRNNLWRMMYAWFK